MFKVLTIIGLSLVAAQDEMVSHTQLLSNGFKMEVESLITKDISYVTEEYVPARLKAMDFLD
jgi:DNA topoisomerase VI subunit A